MVLALSCSIIFLLNKVIQRLCFGGWIIGKHLFFMHSNEPTLGHRAYPPWSDVGKLAPGTPREAANSEGSTGHWCLTKILALLFAQVFHTNIVWKIQLFLSMSWCPAKPNSIDWNIACWCFCKAKEAMATFHPFTEWCNWPAIKNWGILTHSPFGWAHQLFPSCYQSHRLFFFGVIKLVKTNLSPQLLTLIALTAAQGSP